MNFLHKSNKFALVLLTLLLCFAFYSCKYNTNDEYSSVSNGGFDDIPQMLASFMSNNTINDFVHNIQDLDVVYPDGDEIYTNFSPIPSNESYCVLEFKSASPFALGFNLGKTWDGEMEYYPAKGSSDGWGVFTGSQYVSAVKSEGDNNYYVYLRGCGNTVITYNTLIINKVNGLSNSINFIAPDKNGKLGDIECYGTIESLLDWKKVKQGKHPKMGLAAFITLFARCSTLTVAPEITSPDTTDSCYAGMFGYCTSLKKAPGLPSDTTSKYCYMQMFEGCKSLETIPALIAKVLKTGCYTQMFKGCEKVCVEENYQPNFNFVLYYLGEEYNGYNVNTDGELFSFYSSQVASGMFSGTKKSDNTTLNPDTMPILSKNYYISNPIIAGSSKIILPRDTFSDPNDVGENAGTQIIPYATNKLNKYICRPGSKGKIELKVDANSSIWYLFTNSTGESMTIPGVAELSASSTIFKTDSGNSNIIPAFNSILNSQSYKDSSEYDNAISIADLDDRTSKLLSNIDYNDTILTTDEELKKIFEGDVSDIASSSKASSYDKNIAYETKDIGNEATVTSPLGDYVGRQISLNGLNRRFLSNTCRLVRKVKIATGEYKYLVIYTQDKSIYGNISDELITAFADIFLKDGLDNDIYDKTTDIFGTEYGLMSYNYAKKYEPKKFDPINGVDPATYLIDPQDTITIYFTDFETAAALEPTGDYTIAFNDTSDFFRKSKNDRVMIYVSNLFASITTCAPIIASTLAHEFQHILYYNNFCVSNAFANQFGWEEERVMKDTLFTEFFALMTENYLASFIYNNFSSKYRSTLSIPTILRFEAFSKFYGSSNVHVITNLKTNVPNYGNGLYPLYAMLSNYVLQNYGTKVLVRYFRNAVEGLDGFIDAINDVYPYANMTKLKLVADWQTAITLASVSDIDNITYPYNTRGGVTGSALSTWNLLSLMAKVSFGNKFRDNLLLATPIYFHTNYNSSDDRLLSFQLNGEGINFYPAFDNATINDTVSTSSNAVTRLVVHNIASGQTYKAVAPNLPSGMMLTVVALPHTVFSNVK